MKIKFRHVAFAAPFLLSACSGVDHGQVTPFTNTNTGEQYGYVSVSGQPETRIGYNEALDPRKAEQAYYTQTGRRVRLSDIQYGCAQRDSDDQCENGKP